MNMVILWALAWIVVLILALTQLLFILLRRDDEVIYKKLGSPDVFSNNTLAGILFFWRWIYSNIECWPKSTLSKLIVWILRVATPIYFIGLVAVAWSGG